MAAPTSGARRCFHQKCTLLGVKESEAMDDMTFRSDTVLSDVHLHAPQKRQFMVRLNAVGQPVFLSQFRLLWNSEKEEREFKGKAFRGQDSSAEEEYVQESASDLGSPSSTEEEEGGSLKGIRALLDEDGDLEVVRKPRFAYAKDEDLPREKVCPVILMQGGAVLEEHEEESHSSDVIKIEHTMATPLEDVGKQVWRGAFLLSDFILCNQDLFKDRTVLELGGGMGIVSIIMAKAAKTVYCTDIGEDLLDMCERNIALNKHFTEPAESKVKVRVLDWLQNDFCVDPDNAYSWSEEEIAELHDFTTVIVAADVFYDDDLTDAFFKTLYRITSNLKNPSTIYLSIEKRLNFTLRHMDVACEAYNHFQSALHDLQDIKDGRTRFAVEPLQLSFPQRFVYERVEQLELWKITADKICERCTAAQPL